MKPDSCYIVRPMEPGDLPAVVAIDRLSFPTPWQASSYMYELNSNPHACYYSLLRPAGDARVATAKRGWLRRLIHSFRAVDESRVIGFVGLRYEERAAHISTLAVHPAWRRRGLGELLLLAALEKALELDMAVISLEVRPSNHVAQQLYRKYGFQFTHVCPAYYRDGEDAWLMKAPIGDAEHQARLCELHRALSAYVPFQWIGIRPRWEPVGGQNKRDTI